MPAIPILAGTTRDEWRIFDAAFDDGVFTEQYVRDRAQALAGDRHDPDAQLRRAGNPPTYEAIRTQQYTYVHYDDGEREYYNHQRDPNELDNLYGSLSAARVAALNDRVQQLTTCHDGVQCWLAGDPSKGS